MTDKISPLVEYLLKEETWLAFGQVLLLIFLIVVAAEIILKTLKSIISKVLLLKARAAAKTNFMEVSERRERTIRKLLFSFATYSVRFVTVLSILSVIGINIKPILAGAGIVGIAIGFGAQNLVKDIISGFFIIIEHQFAVGDRVSINGFEGVVEEVGLRTTKIHGAGCYIIPNGNITSVTNLSVVKEKSNNAG